MKKLTLLAVFLFSALFLSADSSSPVSWTFEAKKTATNEYDLIFKAKLEKKWHMYSQFLENDNGPIKTTFTFKENDAYARNGVVKEITKGVTKYDKSFGMKVKYFSDEAVFIQHVKLSKNVSSISGSVNYQCCDDSKCLPPVDEDFTFNVKYEAAQ